MLRLCLQSHHRNCTFDCFAVGTLAVAALPVDGSVAAGEEPFAAVSGFFRNPMNLLLELSFGLPATSRQNQATGRQSCWACAPTTASLPGVRAGAGALAGSCNADLDVLRVPPRLATLGILLALWAGGPGALRTAAPPFASWLLFSLRRKHSWLARYECLEPVTCLQIKCEGPEREAKQAQVTRQGRVVSCAATTCSRTSLFVSFSDSCLSWRSVLPLEDCTYSRW